MRLIRVVAAAAILIIVVSGCTSSFFGSGSQPKAVTKAESATPKMGQCWTTNKTNVEVQAWNSWDGLPAVKCSKDHQFITMTVAQLPKELSVTFPEAGKPVSPELSNFANTTCKAAEKDTFAGDAALVARISGWNFFLPTAAEWRSGARFVRCDVVGLSLKSTFALIDLMKLPPSVALMNQNVDTDPLIYAECVNTSKDPSESGPVDDKAAAQFVDCHGQHQWKYASAIDLLVGYPTGYTNAQDILDRSKLACQKITPQDGYFWVYPPAETGWETNHTASCWTNG